jgi:hypothetical protein
MVVKYLQKLKISSMSLQIEKLRRENIDNLKQLFNNTPILSDYNPFKGSSVDEFEWEFFSDDYYESSYYIAFDDEEKELIGTLAELIIPMQTPDSKICYTIKLEDALINIDGKIFYTIKPGDALINIRGLKKHNFRDVLSDLFDKLVENTKYNIIFYWGFTTAVNTFERLGFKNCFTSQQGVYTLKPLMAYKHLVKLNAANKIMQNIQILGLSLVSNIKTFTYYTSKKNIQCEEVNFNRVDEEILLSFLPEKLYSLYLNKYFINWRIIKNPSELNYGMLQFSNKEGKVMSYLIYSIKNDEVFFIEQFLFDKNLNLKVKQRIVYRALRYLKEKNATIIRAMGFNHNLKNKEEIKILSRVGFIFAKKGIPFILKSNDGNIKPEDIYLSRLNTEGTF